MSRSRASASRTNSCSWVLGHDLWITVGFQIQNLWEVSPLVPMCCVGSQSLLINPILAMDLVSLWTQLQLLRWDGRSDSPHCGLLLREPTEPPRNLERWCAQNQSIRPSPHRYLTLAGNQDIKEWWLALLGEMMVRWWFCGYVKTNTIYPLSIYTEALIDEMVCLGCLIFECQFEYLLCLFQSNSLLICLEK